MLKAATISLLRGSTMKCRSGGSMQGPGLASSIYAPTVAKHTVMQEACESMYAQLVPALRMITSQLTTRAMPGRETLIWTHVMRPFLM